MTVQQYVDGLCEAIREGLRQEHIDFGRQMSMADGGAIFSIVSEFASRHKDLPRLPYDAENEKI